MESLKIQTKPPSHKVVSLAIVDQSAIGRLQPFESTQHLAQHVPSPVRLNKPHALRCNPQQVFQRRLIDLKQAIADMR